MPEKDLTQEAAKFTDSLITGGWSDIDSRESWVEAYELLVEKFGRRMTRDILTELMESVRVEYSLDA